MKTKENAIKFDAMLKFMFTIKMLSEKTLNKEIT